MILSSLMTIHLDLRTPITVGRGPFGNRVVYDVSGGTFEGERLSGVVVPSGGDWVLFDADGVARLDVRIMLQTHDQEMIYVHYPVILIPNDKFDAAIADGRMTEYGDTYLVTQPRFETGAERYRWLNRILAIAEGRVSPSAVEYRVYEASPGSCAT